MWACITIFGPLTIVAAALGVGFALDVVEANHRHDGRQD